MKIALPDGSAVVLTAAQLKSLRGAGRGDLSYSPPTTYRARSHRTQGMYVLYSLGNRSNVTVAGRALYDVEPDLLRRLDSNKATRVALTRRGWDVLDAVNAGKFTLFRSGSTAYHFGVFSSLADATAAATTLASRHGGLADAYTPVPIPVGVEPSLLHDSVLAGAR